MGRRHYKYTSNNRNTDMIPPESRDSMPARPEHPSKDEAEESNLKNNFMKMRETLREEIRKSYREMEEKTNQKMQEIHKSFKETQENAIKQLKETIQTVQDLKTEKEKIKKTQTEEMLEVEKLSKQSALLPVGTGGVSPDGYGSKVPIQWVRVGPILRWFSSSTGWRRNQDPGSLWMGWTTWMGARDPVTTPIWYRKQNEGRGLKYCRVWGHISGSGLREQGFINDNDNDVFLQNRDMQPKQSVNQ
ncbi:vomeronasal 2 receptor, 52 precursor [Cricetulus griseus]|nr:vomeronasal 2 receptor, 52 precursor [Cricetulus griseus]